MWALQVTPFTPDSFPCAPDAQGKLVTITFPCEQGNQLTCSTLCVFQVSSVAQMKPHVQGYENKNVFVLFSLFDFRSSAPGIFSMTQHAAR